MNFEWKGIFPADTTQFTDKEIFNIMEEKLPDWRFSEEQNR